jgi:iron only hydrogenase large subunit-like protein
LLEDKSGKGYISSDCPAIVSYIRYYHPDLVDNLSPIVSPMVATSRVIRKKLGDDVKLVFIGPCIAKKAESDEVDEVLTFRELRGMIEHAESLGMMLIHRILIPLMLAGGRYSL